MWIIKGLFVVLWEILTDRFHKDQDIWGWIKAHPEKYSKIVEEEEE